MWVIFYQIIHDFHFQLKFNLVLKFLLYSLGVKSWCFSCDKMDWTYKFCAVMNVVTMCFLCVFLDAHSVISLNEPWFTWYCSKSSDSPNIFEYLCWVDFVSLQFRATAGTGAILAEKDTRCSAFIDVSLETSWASEHQHTFQTQSHFLYSATELEQLKNSYSYFRCFKILIKC